MAIILQILCLWWHAHVQGLLKQGQKDEIVKNKSWQWIVTKVTFFFQNSAWCSFVFLEPPNGACHPFRPLSNVPKTFRPWEKTLPLVLVRHKNWSLPWVLAKQALSFTLYIYIYIYIFPYSLYLRSVVYGTEVGFVNLRYVFQEVCFVAGGVIIFYFFNTLRYPHSSCFYILPHSGNWAIT